MADPYWRYASADKDPRPAIPGYVPTDPALTSHPPWGTAGRIPLDPLRPASYNYDDLAGSRGASMLGVPPAGAAVGGIGRLEDPLLRRDVSLGVAGRLEDPLLRRDASLGIVDRENPALKNSEVLRGDESNMLFVDCLPQDCTRREVGHLFRPFIGFKEIRLIHKEPRRTGDIARVLCFVEFSDIKCAATALNALQGYKFDDKKPDAPVLRIQFAHFPFHPPS